jgi:hypothetical protein
MQTLLLFLFYGSLMLLVYCTGAIQWIISKTRTALLRKKAGFHLVMGMPDEPPRIFPEAADFQATQWKQRIK